MAKGAEKRNDLPSWEVGAHAAGGPSALVDEYYEGAAVKAHRLGFCQIDVANTSPARDTVR